MSKKDRVKETETETASPVNAHCYTADDVINRKCSDEIIENNTSNDRFAITFKHVNDLEFKLSILKKMKEAEEEVVLKFLEDNGVECNGVFGGVYLIPEKDKEKALKIMDKSPTFDDSMYKAIGFKKLNDPKEAV